MLSLKVDSLQYIRSDPVSEPYTCHYTVWAILYGIEAQGYPPEPQWVLSAQLHQHWRTSTYVCTDTTL
jgi:hypothetical protein